MPNSRWYLIVIQLHTTGYNLGVWKFVLQFFTIHCNTLYSNTKRYNTFEYNTFEYNTFEYNTFECKVRGRETFDSSPSTTTNYDYTY
jgi:hypothetical protein